jgi:O-antigen ligase
MTSVTAPASPGAPSRVALLVAAVQLAALVATPWWYGGRSEAIQYGLTAILLLSTAAWAFTAPDVELRVLVPAGAMALWAALQAALGIAGSRVSAVESALVLAAGLGVVLFWCTEARQGPAARWLAYAVVGVAVAEAVFGVAQHAINPRSLYGVVTEGIASPFGSYRNHNHFAGLIEMAALLAAGGALGRTKRARMVDPATVALVGLTLLLAGAHVASRSRGGLIALAGGAAVLGPLWWYALGRRHRTNGKALVAAAALGLVIVGFGWAAVSSETRQHLATLLQGATDEAGRYRVSTYASTLRLWRTNPWVGVGLGNFADTLGAFKTANGGYRIPHAESDPLEFLAESGWLGISLLAWLVVAGLRGFHQRIEEGHDPFRKGIAVGAVAAATALFVHSFFDFNLRVPANALVFCALAGLAVSARTPRECLPAPGCRVLGVALALAGAAAAWRTLGAVQYDRAAAVEASLERVARLSDVVRGHPYMAEAWMARGTGWGEVARGNAVLAQLRLEHAAADFETAIRLRPSWADAWTSLGWVRYRAGDRLGARAAFDRAAALDPVRISIALSRADFFSALGEPGRVTSELIRVRRFNAAKSTEAVVDMAEHRYHLDHEQVESIAAAGGGP